MMGRKIGSPRFLCETRTALCFALLAGLFQSPIVEAIEMTLDLDQKVLPGGQTTCGIVRCLETGSESRLREISEMTIFKSSPRAGPGGRSKVASVSERRPNVSTLWNGVKIDGTWSKQDTTLTLFLAENDDCRSAQFSCQVRYIDGSGEERESRAQIGKTGNSRTQSVETPSSSSSYLTAMIQQTSSALENTRQQLNNRLEDNLRHLENRMEDKIGLLDKALLKVEARIDADGDGSRVDSRASTDDVMKNQIARASRVFGQLTDNISLLEENVKHILQDSSSVLNLLASPQQGHIDKDFGLCSTNISERILKVLEMVANGELDWVRKTKSDLVQENSCQRRDGTHTVVVPEDEPPFLCDSQTDGGGWIVIQRRSSGSVNFFRYWSAYRDGFGSLADDFWLGNERIHALTSTGEYELMVSLEYNGKSAYALYDNFAIGDEASNYTLELGAYTGTAGDSLGYHRNTQFSTLDRDNDQRNNNCAKAHFGGWWYGKRICHTSNLNGKWKQTRYRGPNWSGFSQDNPVTYSEMKIRRV
ncbi:fibrinogen-like protein 1 [Elysia marginata]|uniref:Fibrinogen-like protein 1 n=1 Tax=Elysia marginata TaxID=1093978 RepID=A0AAV4FS98_9GAST|nr:fibrinogen-like protein 1 [Elysia marginata]